MFILILVKRMIAIAVAVTRHVHVFRQQRQGIVVLILDHCLWQGRAKDNGPRT